MRKPSLGIYFIMILVFLIVSSSVFGFPGSKLGLVLLHGKTAGPGARNLQRLVDRFKREGITVETPEMPWSERRYLDADYPTALNEIDNVIHQLTARGVARIVIAGHSMGANAALAYGAYKGGVSGVIMLAPGHVPDGGAKRQFAGSLALAREMIANDAGNKKKGFADNNQGIKFTVYTTPAIYLSYFDPDGMAAMGKSAARLSPAIPLLMVVGTAESESMKQQKVLFLTKLRQIL